MSLPGFPRRRTREERAILNDGFPDTGETRTEILARVKPGDYDDILCPACRRYICTCGDTEFTEFAGTSAPEPGPVPAPLAELRERRPRLPTFPAVPAVPDGDQRDTGPMQRMPKLRKIAARPRPQRPADAAIFVWSTIIDQHIMLCGVCLRSRFADPIAAHMPATFEALRVSAHVMGWRLDAFARWACPACQQTAAYHAPYQVAVWDPAAAAARGTGSEQELRARAEHDLILDVHEAATRYRHGTRAS